MTRGQGTFGRAALVGVLVKGRVHFVEKKNCTVITGPFSSCTLCFNKKLEKPLVSNHNDENKIKYRGRVLLDSPPGV